MRKPKITQEMIEQWKNSYKVLNANDGVFIQVWNGEDCVCDWFDVKNMKLVDMATREKYNLEKISDNYIDPIIKARIAKMSFDEKMKAADDACAEIPSNQLKRLVARKNDVKLNSWD